MIKPIADDFPTEFHKDKIEAFTAAFDRQIEELTEAMNSAVIVALDDAEGIVLDWIGDRVGLTRQQATGRVISPSQYPVGDEDYRKLIRQQIIKNSSNCCLDDVLKCVKGWDSSGGAANSVNPAEIIVSGNVTRDMLPVAAGVNTMI
jgi:hypothetical protein